MLVVQGPLKPAAIRHALADLIAVDLRRLRIASAYVTKEGSEAVYDAICKRIGSRRAAEIDKEIIASVDFGLTEPSALKWWSGLPKCDVYVAGAESVKRDTLKPKSSAFHPKIYAFESKGARTNVLAGSANMTGRGLSANSEVALIQKNIATKEVDPIFSDLLTSCIRLDTDLLSRYTSLRKRKPPSRELKAEVSPPAKPTVYRAQLSYFWQEIEQGNLLPENYDQMWVEALRLEGGSQSQLELPRGSNRFFGFAFDQYHLRDKITIGSPALVAGGKQLPGKILSWHGNNGMERLNLPTHKQGGFIYSNTFVLFRRLSQGSFEVLAAPAGSSLARSWLGAAITKGKVFRVGENTTRMVGLLS